MDRLTDYIQQGQPQMLTGDESLGQPGGPPLAEALTPSAQAVTPVGTVIPADAGEAPSAAVEQPPPSGEPFPPDQGVTTPDPRDEAIRQLQEQLAAQAQQMTQLNHRQAMEAAQREEAQIMARIQAIPDEEERTRAYTTYRFQQQEAVIQAQRAQLSSAQQREQDAAQAVAKNSVVTIRALQEGLPQEYIPLLRKAESPEELEQTIQLLKGTRAQQQAQTNEQQRQAVVDSGVYAAGGSQAGFVPPNTPKERSGDLAGLIAATPPRLANM
jgi:hypothetical protein